MRISDWSSDVCSSDLGDRRQPGGSDCHGDAGRNAGKNAGRTGAADSRPDTDPAAGSAGTYACGGGRLHRSRSEHGGACGRALAVRGPAPSCWPEEGRSEEHTSELQSLMRISYAVFCLKKKKKKHISDNTNKESNKILEHKSNKVKT